MSLIEEAGMLLWLLAAVAAIPDAAETARVVGVAPAPAVHGPAAVAREIVAADRAFAARAAQAGAPAAFREFMDAEDGRGFDGGPAARGADAVSRMPEWSLPIVWAPAEVFASNGGMGVDWGRWRATLPGGGAVTGVYITTWRKGRDGRWKALIDSGVPDAVPAAPAAAAPSGTGAR